MAKELGIGVPVWVGWCPDCQISSIVDGRAKTGTISGGPFMPGNIVIDTVDGSRKEVVGDEPRWNVDLDHGGGVSAPESMLVPIDDGDPTAEPERADRPEEVEA